MNDEIGAEFERARCDRRRERRVDNQQRAALPGDRRHGRDVRDPEQRVGRRFQPDHAGVVADRRLHVGGLRRIDRRQLDAEPGQRVPRHFGGARVVGVAHDQVIALGQVAEQDTGRRRHAGRKRDRGLGALEHR